MKDTDCLYGLCYEDSTAEMPVGWTSPDGWSPPTRRLQNATITPSAAPTAAPTDPTAQPTMQPTKGPMPGYCISPPKNCPTDDTNYICSGHGMCNYTDVSENLIPVCNMTDVNCKANCHCLDGYGGRACSYDADKLEERARARLILCSALYNATQLTDPSADLLVSLAASLKESYDHGFP